MFKTTLYFPTYDILCQFRKKLKTSNIILFSKLHVLAAELPEEEIHLACNQYNATVIRKQRAGKIVAHHPVSLKEAV